MQLEAEATIQLIAEIQRRTEETAAASAAATTATLDQALKADEAPRLEEARQERLREGAARADALATEVTRLEAAKGLAEAREQEHKTAVQSARALKAEQDRAHGRLDAAKAANAAIKHGEEILAANREANKQLRACLEHARQVAQQTADMDATKLAEMAKATANEVKLVKALASA